MDIPPPTDEPLGVWGYRMTITPRYPRDLDDGRPETARLKAKILHYAAAALPGSAGGTKAMTLDAHLVRYVNVTSQKRGLGATALLSSDWAALIPDSADLVAWPILTAAMMEPGAALSSVIGRRLSSSGSNSLSGSSLGGWEESKENSVSEPSSSFSSSQEWIVVTRAMLQGDASMTLVAGTGKQHALLLAAPVTGAKSIAAVPLGFRLPLISVMNGDEWDWEEDREDAKHDGDGGDQKQWLKVELGGTHGYLQANPSACATVYRNLWHVGQRDMDLFKSRTAGLFKQTPVTRTSVTLSAFYQADDDGEAVEAIQTRTVAWRRK